MTQQGNDSPDCHGNGAVHCCYVPGTGVADPLGTDQSVCPLLEVGTVPGRQWVCALRRELGDWQQVHADPRYQPIKKAFTATGTALCGDWRVAGQCCFGTDNPPVHNL